MWRPPLFIRFAASLRLSRSVQVNDTIRRNRRYGGPFFVRFQNRPEPRSDGVAIDFCRVIRYNNQAL